MDPIRSSLAARSYEDFVPPSDWIREEGFDMLLMELPGFRKDHLKVQLDNFGNLRTFGERPLDGNKYRRFRKEFRLPDNCNTSEIRAKFEDGILTVTVPKPTTTPAEPATPPSPARAKLTATAKPPPPPPPPRDTPTFPTPPPRDEPTFSAPLPPPTPPKDEPTSVTPPPPPPPPPPPTKTTTPEPQTMSKRSEPTEENAAGKVEEVEEEAMREEAANYEAGDLAVGLKRKRRQLVVNIVVAALLLVLLGVGSYAAYKFNKVAKADTTQGLLHYEL